jgi:ABC-type lipoprotein release transport system permease subunit
MRSIRWQCQRFAGAAILMIITAGAAAYWPARQAAHAGPMTALRDE